MKLFVVLSVLAYGYAAKLDRTYLPPVSAATAGGSPGALTAPIQSGSGLQQGHISTGFQPERSDFNQPESGFIQGSIGNQPGLNDFVSSTNGALNGNRHVMPSGYESSSGTGPDQTKLESPGPGNLNEHYIQQLGSHGANPFAPERPQSAADRNAEILRYINENNIDNYNYNYETSNGISAEEAGEASNGVRAQGAYSYTGDDGNLYSITYTADENGYQPQGDHLPTPHPIPEEILKSIEENARAAAAGIQEGSYRPEEYESEISQQQYDTGLSGLNRPVGEDYNSSHNFQRNQGQVINHPQGNQYSKGQADSQEFLRNKQSGFDNSQTSDRQREENNGYKYNQPQNDFGPIVHSQGTSHKGTTPGFSSGNIPNLRSPTQYQAQSNINTRNQGQDDSFNQGHNTPFVTSKTSNQIRHNPQTGSDNSQTSERQGHETNGYKYNQPQIQKETSYPGSNSAFLSGNIPHLKSYTQYQDQSIVHSGNQAPSQDDSFNQGQNAPFVTSKTSHQIRHNTQSGSDNSQTSERQGHETNGYKYNHPQNDFRSFVNGQGSLSQEIQKETSYPGSNSALLNGDIPHLKSYSHPISQDSSFNRGQNTQFDTSKTSHQVPHKTQGSNVNQQFGSTIPSGEGYQYQRNSNQNTLNYNAAVRDGSGNRGGFLNEQGNGNKQNFANNGQGTFPFNHNGNQPTVGTNVEEKQDFNGSKGSQPLPELYQYNAPDQSSRNQEQSFKNSGSNGSNVKQGSEQFGGPRQPPSYTPEGGYKY